jgi:hypothetical protein
LNPALGNVELLSFGNRCILFCCAHQKPLTCIHNAKLIQNFKTMRTTKYFAIFFLMLIIVSCKKKSNTITYPNSIYYGNNILSYPDGTVFDAGPDYEMGAELGNDASLTLMFTNTSSIDTAVQLPVWYYSEPTGWAVTDYNDVTNTQKFMSTQSGKIDLKILFMSEGTIGSCKIDFYENSTTIKFTKHYLWK